MAFFGKACFIGMHAAHRNGERLRARERLIPLLHGRIVRFGEIGRCNLLAKQRLNLIQMNFGCVGGHLYIGKQREARGLVHFIEQIDIELRKLRFSTCPPSLPVLRLRR